MQRVVFLDTSVLLNVLDVPHRNGDRDSVSARFRLLVDQDALLVIPIAAVVEVGNHIAQVAGPARRECAARFADFLRSSLTGQPPWVVSGASWDVRFLAELLQGHEKRPGMVDLCSSGLGTGDASILLELERYRGRSDLPSGLPIELWSLDHQLQAYGDS